MVVVEHGIIPFFRNQTETDVGTLKPSVIDEINQLGEDFSLTKVYQRKVVNNCSVTI